MPDVTGYIAERRDHQPPAEFEPLDPWEGNSAQDEVADDVSDVEDLEVMQQTFNKIGKNISDNYLKKAAQSFILLEHNKCIIQRLLIYHSSITVACVDV